jgi:hypothetical protein
MKYKHFINCLVLLIVLTAITGLTACGPSTAASLPSVAPVSTPPASPEAPLTATPSSTVSLTPSPSVTASPTPSPSPAVSPASSSTPTATPSPTPTPTVEKKPAEITVASNKATFDFPNSVTFSISGTSVLPVSSITLEYGTYEHSVIEETTRVQPTFNPGTSINTNYTWDMRKTGSLPPKAVIWYQWRFQDEAKRDYITSKENLSFEDTRFQWKLESSANLDVYYHDQDISMIKDLMSGVQTNLSRIKLNTVIPAERKIKILIYRNYDEVKSSGLFKQEWVGGQAFPNYNIIIMAVNSSILNWAKGALPHEVTHLIVHETVFGAFGDIPRWLDEGFARYSEGPMSISDKQALDQAVQNKNLMSVRSLGSSFPTDATLAGLAYAESSSIVSYLISTYGWDKIKTLLDVFKDGSTYDNALKKVYNFDSSGLDKEWKAAIGAG